MAPYKSKVKPTSNVAILCIITAIAVTLCIHYVFIFHMTQKFNSNSDRSARGRSLQGIEDDVRSYHWPSPTDTGGLFGKIYVLQNPSDCKSSKYLAWQSLKNHEQDTRGLTAWVSYVWIEYIALFTGGSVNYIYTFIILLNILHLVYLQNSFMYFHATKQIYLHIIHPAISPS